MSYQRETASSFPVRARLRRLAVCFVIALAGAAQATDAVHGMRNNPLVQQAVLDVAQRESVSPEEITLESFEEVVWPDTGMGCTHPDMRYKQVPQDGARIILRVKGKFREYHSGGNRAPFLCSLNPLKR